MSIATLREYYDTPVMNIRPALYARPRFPSEIIIHCLWLYFRFSLSYRDVVLLMAQRGVALTYETVRQ